MNIKSIPVNPFEMNCYVCHDEASGEGVIIDPGVYSDEDKEKVSSYIKNNSIDIKYILNTHGHLDHVLGNNWAKKTFKVPVLIHKEDMELVNRAPEQGTMFGVQIEPVPEPDRFIEENETVSFGNITFKVIHTPGHSPGGVCFINEKDGIIVAGDCVFKGSIGRTDLWKGDINILLNSIKNKIFSYPDEYKIYPGHYDDTTIGSEKANNPFLNGDYDIANLG